MDTTLLLARGVLLAADSATEQHTMNMTLIFVIGAVLVAGVGVWVYLRAQGSTAIRFSHFRCPGCRRRLRYKEQQAGHKGECSNCGRELIFPPVSDSTD